MNNASKSAVLFVFGLLFNAPSVAGLIDRGNGMIYDDVLDLTWLQDANFAFTSGYSQINATGGKDGPVYNIQSDGKMSWQAALEWAEGLVFGGFEDWRLPSIEPLNGSTFSYGNNAKDGSADYGYNITSTQSELAFMFNVNLGLESLYTSVDTINSNWVLYNDVIIPDTGLIQNLKGYGYWSETQDLLNTSHAWMFANLTGNQTETGKNNSYYAWAVRQGDVVSKPHVSVSEPASITLLGLMFLGLSLRLRKRV
jgi:hypothetical protein